jgi:hypothetical protein
MARRPDKGSAGAPPPQKKNKKIPPPPGCFGGPPPPPPPNSLGASGGLEWSCVSHALTTDFYAVFFNFFLNFKFFYD